MQDAIEFRGLIRGDTAVKWHGHNWPHPPSGDYPVYPLQAGDWRVYLGGVLARTQIPTLDGSGTESVRFVALFNDPAAAAWVLQQERTMLRRAAKLVYTGGQWYLHMRYRTKEGLVAVRKGKQVVYQKRRRWGKAPDGWPRDRWGDPVSTRTAARMRAAGEPGSSSGS